jgi:deoxyribonuclease V
MKFPNAPHSWIVTPKRAIAIQKRLAARVSQSSPHQSLRLVAGLDAAFSRDGGHCIGGVVVWDIESQAVLDQHVAARKLTFPYVPGLLSFREAPALLAALRKLRCQPDVLMCDAHGLSHLRRFGLACHVGVISDVPTIGCAKSRLVGVHREPGVKRGSKTQLVDDGDVVGLVLRTRTGVKPVYVSVGHRMDLDTAVRLVLRCAVKYRLPEPTRLADRLVAEAKATGAGHQP